MMVMERKHGERLIIVGPGLHAQVTILNVDGERVKLGVSVLADVPLHEERIHENPKRPIEETYTAVG
jgi:sRNA-binding carbon storage regulator CsrA